MSSFLPWPQPADVREVAVLSALPTFTYRPSSRGNIAQLIALRAYVDGLSGEEPKTAAVIASSFTFNGSIYDAVLRSMNIPEAAGPSASMIYFAAVDRRDAFSWNVLKADYPLVADPVQTHLGEDSQRLATVYIYRRSRPVTARERQDISDALTAAYPDCAELYAAPENFDYD